MILDGLLVIIVIFFLARMLFNRESMTGPISSERDQQMIRRVREINTESSERTHKKSEHQ